MTTLLTILAACLSLTTLMMFGALVELFRQVDQMRLKLGLVDEVQGVDFSQGVSLSSLPIELIDGLAPEGRFAILFLSVSCTTCSRVVEGIPAKRTPNLLVLVQAATRHEAAEWLSKQGLEENPRVAWDVDQRIASALAISVTPACVQFEGLISTAATTVPSVLRLRELLRWINFVGEFDITHYPGESERVQQ
jgi:hypothetical protein